MEQTAGSEWPFLFAVRPGADRLRRAHLTFAATYWVAKRLPVVINCELSYTERDPYAVTLILDSAGEQPVRWVFSRQLLADGLAGSAGEGDVTVWPEGAGDDEWFLWLEVGRAPHTALFEMTAGPVTEWLLDTYRLVPEGREGAWL